MSMDVEDLKLGTILVQMDQRASPLPLKQTDVSGQIKGPVASVTVTQRFANPFPEVIELEYLFPLPHEAAVTDYHIQIGSRTITAQIKEAEAARKTYQEAVEAGKRASLLEQRRPNLFAIQIGNVQPGEEIITTLHYQERLHFESDHYEFVFPMGITPKYHTADTSITEADSVSAPIADDAEIAPVTIHLDVDAGVSVSNPTSPSHALALTQADDQHFSLTLAERTIPNKDFVLRYTVSTEAVQTGVWASDDGDFETVLVTLLPPQLTEEMQQVEPREFIYVLDRSGSMSRGPMQQARNALVACLKELKPDDTFRIEVFNKDREWNAPEVQFATPANIQAAEKWLSGIDARGGTEILGAIEEALALPLDAERQRVVVFLTDGAVSAEERAITLVRKQAKGARIFTFGIGPSVNRALLTKMAQMGKGNADFIGLQERIEDAIARFRDYVRYPALNDLKLEWQGAESWDTYPAELPDLYIGQPLEVVSRLNRLGSDAVTVTVTGTRKGESVTVSAPIPVPDQTDPVLKRIWARYRVDSLLDQRHSGGDVEKIRTQVIALALENRLVTPYTSFVAVDSEVVDTPDDGAQQVQVSQALPEGLDIKGFGGMDTVSRSRSDVFFASMAAPAPNYIPPASAGPPQKSAGLFHSLGAMMEEAEGLLGQGRNRLQKKPKQEMRLVLTLRDSGKQFIFDVDSIQELIIGLRDAKANIVPDIDLLDYQGKEQGVVLKHASITQRDGKLHLLDLNSPTGTFLNGRKLRSDRPATLRAGDEIRLGRCILDVEFESA